MKELVLAVLIGSLTLFSSAVMAQDSHLGKHSYFGVTAGGVFGVDMDGDMRSPEHMSLGNEDLANGGMIGVKLGHFPEKLSRIIAIELEGFMVTGTDVDGETFDWQPIGSEIEIDADITVMVTMLNFLAQYPHGQFHPYAGFGLGWTWFDIEDTRLKSGGVTGSVGDLDDDNFGYQILLGLGIDVTDTLSVDLGYRYFHAEPEVDFTAGADFDLKLTYKAHMITAGLNYRF